MDDFPVNPVDIIVAVVLLLSAILAFSRGIVRETLGIGAWIGAAFTTVFAFPHVQPLARGLVESQLIADGGAALVTFLLALIVLVVISQVISSRIQGSKLGPLDRSLGFIFGLVRGAVIICVAYLLFVWAMNPEDRPPWIAKAKTLPYIVQGADALRSVVPDDVEKKAEETVRKQSGNTSDSLKALRRYEELNKPPATPPKPSPETQ